MLTPPRIAVVVVAIIGLVLTAVAYDSQVSTTEPTPTPLPPTATIGPDTNHTLSRPTLTLTPTPQPPSASEVIRDVRGSLEDLNTYHFALTITEGEAFLLEATGDWIFPADYDISISLPLCPPQAPGGLVPDSAHCLPIHAYRETKSGSVTATRTPFLADGEWGTESHLDRYNLAFLSDGRSPIHQLLRSIGFDDDAIVRETTYDGIPAYQVASSPGAGHAPRSVVMTIARDTSALLAIDLGLVDSTQQWIFTRHDEPIIIVLSFANDTEDPLEWLEHKTIRLVENDSSFATSALRPFLNSDAKIVADLAEILSDGSMHSAGDYQSNGRILTIHFTDGTSFALSQAAAINTIEPITDHWYLHALEPIVVRSSDFTAWWNAIDDHFAPVNLITWPTTIAAGERLLFAGEGWPDQQVVLDIFIDDRFVTFGEVQTTQGAWQWAGLIPDGIELGLRDFRISTPVPTDFTRAAVIETISIQPPSAFAIDERRATAIYATADPSFLPTGAPLWVGLPEHRDAILKLITAINGAREVPTPSTESDRTSTLHIGHPDGTETLLHFAGACDEITETTSCSDNRWMLTHADAQGDQIAPPTTVDSVGISAWWGQRANTMPGVAPLIILTPLDAAGSFTFSGHGWPTGDSVNIMVSSAGEQLATATAPLTFGNFSVKISRPPFTPKEILVTATGSGLNGSTVTLFATYE